MAGVNLVDPATAPKVIKTWDERLDENDFVESGVDDEVSQDRGDCGIRFRAIPL